MSARTIWDRLYALLQNPYGVAGLMGNLESESALRSNNLQDSYEHAFGMNDEQYTVAVDNGTYGNFVNDCGGYGLAQWTFSTRKAALLAFAKQRGASIGDLNVQLDFLCYELSTSYPAVLSALKNATSVRVASDVVLKRFECPADQSEGVQAYRARLGQKWYDQFAGSSPSTTTVPTTPPTAETTATLVDVNLPIVKSGSTGQAAKSVQMLLISRGYYCGGSRASGREEPDGIFGEKSAEAVRSFQEKVKLTSDGVIGADTWSALITK